MAMIYRGGIVGAFQIQRREYCIGPLNCFGCRTRRNSAKPWCPQIALIASDMTER